ncbi:MAG: hypothetical protein AAB300_02515 [Nitrospirota bacterium]
MKTAPVDKVNKRVSVSFIAILLSLFTSGCMVRNVPMTHLVMYDKEGQLVNPTDNLLGLKVPGSRYIPIEDQKEYYDHIFTAIKNHPLSSDGKRKVLFYIHGGLNTQKGTLKRARELSPKILEDGYSQSLLTGSRP